jgi:hypothetical protein
VLTLDKDQLGLEKEILEERLRQAEADVKGANERADAAARERDTMARDHAQAQSQVED